MDANTSSLPQHALPVYWKKVGAAFTYFLQTLPQDTESDEIINRTELRPQIELDYEQVLSGKWNLSHRYWNEFRFFENDNNSIEYGNIRFRYQLSINYQLMEKVYVVAFNEVLLNIGSNITNNVFDQNRLGGSIRYSIDKNWKADLTYINWFQQQPSGIDFFDRDILRVVVVYTINPK